MTFIHNAEKRLLGSTLGLAAAVGAASPILLLFGAAAAHADVANDSFQSPSGNIECWVRTSQAGCDIGDYTYVPPTPLPGQQSPQPCHAGFLVRFNVNQGHAPTAYCQPGGPLTDLHAPGLPTLDYGQMRSAGTMTCESEPSGVMCTDSSTRHFFRVSRDSYQVG
jgi:hypothetical protein